MKKMWILVIGMALLAGTAQAALIVSSPPYSYSQNFNTLATSGSGNTWTDNSSITGWWWDYGDVTRDPDIYGYIADIGTELTGAGHSYGAVSSSERAMGGLSTSTRSYSPFFGVQFQNQSGNAISFSDIKISYTGEAWRQNAVSQTLFFSYATNTTGFTSSSLATIPATTWNPNTTLDFIAPTIGVAGALDGNNVANQVAFSNEVLAATGTWANNDYLFLRWTKNSVANSAGLAVDDFSISIIPEPASFGLLALGAIGVRLLRRRRM
jgi:hypothetical protein